MAKYCPFLIAAKWHQQKPNYEDLQLDKCECLEASCALWDCHSYSCGFLATPITQTFAVQN